MLTWCADTEIAEGFIHKPRPGAVQQSTSPLHPRTNIPAFTTGVQSTGKHTLEDTAMWADMDHAMVCASSPPSICLQNRVHHCAFSQASKVLSRLASHPRHLERLQEAFGAVNDLTPSVSIIANPAVRACILCSGLCEGGVCVCVC
jgi:hypothetical protein